MPSLASRRRLYRCWKVHCGSFADAAGMDWQWYALAWPHTGTGKATMWLELWIAYWVIASLSSALPPSSLTCYALGCIGIISTLILSGQLWFGSASY